MSTLTELNTYSAGNIEYDGGNIITARSVGGNFFVPICTFDLARAIGPLTGNGIQVNYEVAADGTVITFVNTSNSINPLTTAESPTDNFKISGMRNPVDFAASIARCDPPSGNTGNVTITVTVTNTNVSESTNKVSYTVIGIPS
jgi:hypothetical protein